MKYLPKPIIYLDTTDFDDDGNLTNPSLPQDKPIFTMFQANFCGHCTNAKPDFYKFAMNNINTVICATIQGDSDLPQVKAIKDKINKIYPNFYGFPSYLIFYKGKKIIYDQGRTANDLQKYIDKLLS
jgi:thiol-disulfide isomerase/thioredoxin